MTRLAVLFTGLLLAASSFLGTLVPRAHTEDSEGWNCQTQGNMICGPL